MAMHVPVLPIAYDDLPKCQGQPECKSETKCDGGSHPEGMIRDLQALLISNENLAQTPIIEAIMKRISQAAEDRFAPSVYTQQVLHRTEMIYENSKEIYQFFGAQHIRQRASFSSFSLPDKYPEHDLWTERNPRFENTFRSAARKERQILEKHACEAGYSLLLDFHVPQDGNSTPNNFKHDKIKLSARLRVLLELLNQLPNELSEERIKVYIDKGKMRSVQLMVGNMLLVEAPIPLGR